MSGRALATAPLWSLRSPLRWPRHSFLPARCGRRSPPACVLIFAAACSSAPPLSGARATRATAAPAAVPAPVAQPAPSTLNAPPAPERGNQCGARAAGDRPDGTVGAPGTRSDTIALILPLESPTYGRAAEAVKAGFLAAAARAGSSARVRVIGHGDDGVLLAIAGAEASGVGAGRRALDARRP